MISSIYLAFLENLNYMYPTDESVYVSGMLVRVVAWCMQSKLHKMDFFFFSKINNFVINEETIEDSN